VAAVVVGEPEINRPSEGSSRKRDARESVGGAADETKFFRGVIILENTRRRSVRIMEPLLADAGVKQQGRCDGEVVIEPELMRVNVLVAHRRHRNWKPVRAAVFVAGVFLPEERHLGTLVEIVIELDASDDLRPRKGIDLLPIADQ